MFRFLLLAGFLVSSICNFAQAQEPTQAQRDAIRSACRSDFIAHCSSVQPGGKDALECLLRNEGKLSTSCKTAVSAVAPKPETPAAAAAPAVPAATPVETPTASSPSEPAPKTVAAKTTDDQIKAVRQACTLNDFMAHCSWIAPSSPEVLLCLKANSADLSSSCQSALQSVPAAATPTVVETPPAAPAAKQPASAKKPEATRASAAQAAPQKPTAKQTSAIRSACRSDFMSHCAGVQPGGAEALQCLQRNAAELSKGCQSAVAAIGPGPTPAATKAGSSEAAALASPAPSAAAPQKPTAAQTSAIRAACRSDFMSHCSGVQPGGAEALQCLQSHAASLSATCKTAVAAIGSGEPAAAAAAPSSTPATTPAVAPLGPMPPMRPREALAILALCSTEQRSLCSGVPIGGGRVLDCLADNAPRLSPGCYDALARARR